MSFCTPSTWVRGGDVPVGMKSTRVRHRRGADNVNTIESLEVVESARIPLVKYVDAASNTA